MKLKLLLLSGGLGIASLGVLLWIVISARGVSVSPINDGPLAFRIRTKGINGILIIRFMEEGKNLWILNCNYQPIDMVRYGQPPNEKVKQVFPKGGGEPRMPKGKFFVEVVYQYDTPSNPMAKTEIFAFRTDADGMVHYLGRPESVELPPSYDE